MTIRIDDVRARLREAGLEPDTLPPGGAAPAWLVDYDSTRMDGRALFCVPVDALDPRVAAALDAVDGQDVAHGTPDTRAAGLLVALALGAASPDDVEVDGLDLPEPLRLGDDAVALYETLYGFRVDQAGVSTTIDRVIVVVDRV